ncbi:syncytin-A-like isoform X1 [Perca flavescens]|uniref:syncytin-A-like isoform X1 n=1 Tax=Perca flavescens TaxID=8167 RepID=UPI00106EB4F2|nr:syncytin-A-like isoform X1 [Perca flavescens]XP_028460770.1 syncytin-A-like isoform X1 [Perca flavescens]XP_028460771.1 syncytin-A-like isoform X1 [Perca flavescens]
MESDVCRTLSLLYPRVRAIQPPPGVVAYLGNYTCITQPNSSTMNVGHLLKKFCMYTYNTSSFIPNVTQSMFNNQSKGLADVWWMCGTQPRLRPSLPAKWGGTCALVSLLLPITMLPISAGKLEETVQSTYHKHSLKRAKRDTDLGFGTWGDPSTPFRSIDSRVYIDAIGIPRGVPEEFKAQNQIAKGFESILPWITKNKNVDWINYIYYNQQRFLNRTRDGLRGVSEQLAASSLMAFQNRMALDMLLAEKGGVCHMFGDACYTFIPNNTAPDGSITRALEGLTSLANELAENSGVAENLITSWLEDVFGKYKAIVLSMLMSVAVFVGILVCCGCCCIPCCRTLVNRWIDVALTKKRSPERCSSSLLHAPVGDGGW